MKKTEKISIFLVGALLVCGVIISSILAYTGCRYSYYSTVKDSWTPLVLMGDSILVHLLFAVGAGAFCCLIDWWMRKKLSMGAQEKLAVVVLVLAALVIFVAGTVFVQMNPYYPTGDQLNTTAGSYYCLHGNYLMLTKGGYIGLYEQQKGFMFLYEILFWIFGDFCYKVAGEFHVIFAVTTLYFGYAFIKLHFEKPSCRMIYSMLMAVCFPFLIYLPYIYGDIPAICFCTILFWALSKYAVAFKKGYIVLGAVVSALALMCRMNTWIVLIAVAIGLVLLAIQKKAYQPLVAALCILLSAAGAIKAVDVMYEVRSGYESGVGIPSVLWIAMGLQETNGEAGVYNRYQQGVFESNDFEREISAQIGKDYITARLQEFKDNPAMAKDFFWKKMSSQWTEPLFESIISTSTFKEDRAVPGWIQNLYHGPARDTVWKTANYYQSFVYVAFCLFTLGGLIGIRKDKFCSTKWIPLIAIVGGFLFSLMWENQCRYCLPYYMFMLMYVPQGFMQAEMWIKTVIRNRKKKALQQA